MSLVIAASLMMAGHRLPAQDRAAQNADLYPGTDLGAKIRAADAALGGGPGVISVNSPATLSTPVVLGGQHNLVLNAHVLWSASMTLAGSNDVSCSGKGGISSTLAAAIPVFTGRGVRQVTIHNCAVSMVSSSPVFAGNGPTSLSMHHLTVTGGTLAQINPDHGESAGDPASNLNFDHNSVQGASPSGGEAGLLLVNTTTATVDSNSFTGVSSGLQWWGGDSARGNVAQVTRTGKLTLTGNHCHAVTACLWGSMGYDITVAHNTADGCIDVCFDAEGAVDTSFVGNTATNCNNGCGAIFFFSRNTSFVGNTFSGDSKGGGLFFIKNSSADPVSHAGLKVSKNTLTCATTCNAFLQEAVSQASFDANVVTNGVYTPAGFGQNVSISHNQFVFSRALPTNAAVIRGPSITGGTSLTIDGNSVSSSVSQGTDAACISAVWNDFNNTDTYVIRNNRCEGASPFPVSIATETAGANPGPHVIWRLEGNFGTGRIVHKQTTNNEIYTLK